MNERTCNGMEWSSSIIIRLIFLLLGISTGAFDGVEDSSSQKHETHDIDLLTKIRLTQKGYIQFLRYVQDVPTMTEYTFCLWMKSYNLTYSHSLLSYSRHEEERLIRVWISPHGSSINLEIHGFHVFEIPLKFEEHKWYHICQSWSSSRHASWELFVNGHKEIQGYTPKLDGIRIKSGGDMVVGQEYTDFDKGLEDGIEGDIFGFNFVLSSTFPTQTFRSSRSSKQSSPSYSMTSFHPTNTRYPEQYFSESKPIFLNRTLSNYPRKLQTDSYWDERKPGMKLIVRTKRSHYSESVKTSYAPQLFYERPITRTRSLMTKSLGLSLVELSGHCSIGKGAPLSGKKVLISWTRTTVRVFGGAIVKHVKPFC